MEDDTVQPYVVSFEAKNIIGTLRTMSGHRWNLKLSSLRHFTVGLLPLFLILLAFKFFYIFSLLLVRCLAYILRLLLCTFLMIL